MDQSVTPERPAADGNFRIPRAPEPLGFTGERMTGAIEGQIEFEHYHRYCLARDLCAGLDVLDVASGEGYGAAMLAGVARSVAGVEIDAASVGHAASAYRADNLRFEQGDALAIPLADAAVDAVVSFETIEHVADPRRFLREVRRVLRPGGLLLVSTPDRSVYSAAGEAANPYHVVEMTEPEFRRLLESRFAHVAILRQRPALGSLLAAPGSAGWRSYERRGPELIEASDGLARAPYLVAAASDAPLPDLPSSAYLDRRRVHEAVEAHARLDAAERRLEAETRAGRELDAALAERDRAIAGQTAALAAQAAELARMQEALRARDDTLNARREALHAARSEAAALRGEILEAGKRQADAAEEIEARGRHVDHLLALLAGRAEDWERAHDALRAAAAEADRLERERARLGAENARLTGSLSWRLTAPVRVVTRRLPGLGPAAHAAGLLLRGELGAHRALRRRREAEAEALRATPLFDAEWYLDQHPELRAAGHDAAAHYAWIGAWAGAAPNAWFDPAWYVARHPEITEGGWNPLLHWVQEGARGRLDPNPFLDAAWYVDRYPDAASSGLDPLLHWIRHGGPERRDPNPMLDSRYYMEGGPEAEEPSDPLLHWWRHGAGSGRDPHPLFDAAWYREQNGLGAADPLAHWLSAGRSQGLATFPHAAGAGGAWAPLRFAAEPEPDVSIVIPAYGNYRNAYRCLHAVKAGAGERWRFEVILADDCPERRVAPRLAERIPGLRILVNPRNRGFLRTCNAAERLAVGRYVVFLNDDALVHEGWLDPLVRLAEADRLIGMVGCKLLNADGTLQEAGGAMLSDGWGLPFGKGRDASDPECNHVREVDVVVGACMLVRRDAFDALGGLDLRYAPAYYEEFDLAFALREAGLRVMYQPASVVTHLGSDSYGAEARDRQSARNRALFAAKWARRLKEQPDPKGPRGACRRRPARAGAVLVIEDRVPEWDRHAGAVTLRHYIGLMQDMGFSVTLAPVDDVRPTQPYAAILQQQGVEVLYGAGTLARWLEENGRALAYVWCARPDVALPLLPAIRAASTAPILYYTHDLHHLRERRRWELERDPAVLDESKRLMRVEHAVFGAVDCVMTPSEEEARIIRACASRPRVQVIPPYLVPPAPSGASGRASEAGGASRDSIIFVGGFAHPPNVDAAVWLAGAVMPLVWAAHPDVRVLIAGADPPPELRAFEGPRVEVLGHAPDLAPLYARARASVSPLRYGAGVKGKIIGSIEAGVPVVTTSVGNEGIGLRDGAEAMIADDAEGLAAAIAALWSAPERAAGMARAARAVLRRYAPEAAADALRAAMGLFQCRVCGLQEPARLPEPRGERPEAPACPRCRAPGRLESVADALVAAYRVDHENSLRALLPRLAGMRIHSFGAAGPLCEELGRLGGFSRSDAPPAGERGTSASGGALDEAMPCLTFTDGTFDLLISQDVMERAADPRAAFRECFRALKPGGRLVFSAHLDASAPDVAAMAVEAGFEVLTRERLAPGGADAHLATLDAVRHAAGAQAPA